MVAELVVVSTYVALLAEVLVDHVGSVSAAVAVIVVDHTGALATAAAEAAAASTAAAAAGVEPAAELVLTVSHTTADRATLVAAVVLAGTSMALWAAVVVDIAGVQAVAAAAAAVAVAAVAVAVARLWSQLLLLLRRMGQVPHAFLQLGGQP